MHRVIGCDLNCMHLEANDDNLSLSDIELSDYKSSDDKSSNDNYGDDSSNDKSTSEESQPALKKRINTN